jgi:hypothetical protein
MRTLAALAFIAGVAALAAYLAQRPTVADGEVMAADLLEQLRERSITAVTCDREIPIGPRGAVFECTATASDGSTARIEYTMGRDGALAGKILDAAGPLPPPSQPPSRTRIPPSGDPWSN